MPKATIEPRAEVDVTELNRMFANIPTGPYSADARGNGWGVRAIDTDPKNTHHWPYRLCASIPGQTAGCDPDVFGFIAGVINAWPQIAAALATITASVEAEEGEMEEARDEETYQIGKRDGYEEAVQNIDELTGGDGEYRLSPDPERNCPGPQDMIARIVERFEALPASVERQPTPKTDEARRARDMTDTELTAALDEAEGLFAERGEHGGSPGEAVWEWMNEIETEQKRRTSSRQGGC